MQQMRHSHARAAWWIPCYRELLEALRQKTTNEGANEGKENRETTRTAVC